MEPKQFKPGFEFELRTKTDPDTWEKIKIHPNCSPVLIAQLVKDFKATPTMFRTVPRQITESRKP